VDNKVAAWDEVAAPHILMEQEMEIWRRIPHAEARHRWLRGRVSAKDAICLFLRNRLNVLMPWESISVLPDKRGQPQVSCASLSEIGLGVCVSISHCENSSVALVVECTDFCRGVGIDVAFQAGNHDGLAEGGFAAVETALLENCSAPERADWLLRLWCAKEAVGKALGLGLMGNPLNYVVRRVDRRRGTVDVEINVKPQSTAWSPGTAQVTTHVGCDRGMAFAVARLEKR
jgi:phosphopantetheinyl transferase